MLSLSRSANPISARRPYLGGRDLDPNRFRSLRAHHGLDVEPETYSTRTILSGVPGCIFRMLLVSALGHELEELFFGEFRLVDYA